MMELIKKLSEKPRVAGTKEGLNNYNLICQNFDELDYNVKTQTVNFMGWELVKPPKLKINNKMVKCLPLLWSGSGSVRGRLIKTTKMKTFEAYEWLRYKIVDNEKTKGYIITRPDVIWLQLVDRKSELPYFMVYPDTCKLLMGGGNFTVEGNVKSRLVRNQKIRNIITKTNSKKRTIVCAHYDSILGSPGANDNATGTAAMLELAKMNRNNTNLQFIAFDAEEWNKYGSYSYVRSLSKRQLKQIKVVINLDMIGSKIGKPFIICSKELNKIVSKSLRKTGENMEIINIIRPPFDYWPFYKKGIPIISFGCSPYHYCHDPEDTIDKISLRPMNRVVKVADKIINELS